MALDILRGKVTDAYLFAKITDIETSALDQIQKVTSLPWIFRCAIMPDVHAGIGCTIGSVVAMKGAVSPALVGVDIGCGMAAIKTNLNSRDLPDDLKNLRHSIERGIPLGFHEHKEPLKDTMNNTKFWEKFSALSEKVQSIKAKAMRQCGSLGGGNHFIEICLDAEDKVWLMLHSGSRNIGKTIAEIHIDKAKKLTHNLDLQDKDCAVFLANSEEMKAYRNDLYWAQEYAWENRRTMLNLFKGQMKHYFPQIKFQDEILCHHNYVAEERHFGEDVFVTRKGAIRAGKGELGIIPGSMGTNSYIVEGLGDADAMESAPHGAGRKMSRGEARRRFTNKDLEEQTSGVECRKDNGVVDEIPAAYKDINEVIENSKSLVKVVARLKQVMCIKG